MLMEENSTLDSKLKKYASIAGSITAVVGTASAQVNYTDLNPDVLVTGQNSNYVLDLNGDLQPDYIFLTNDTAFVTNYAGLPISVDLKGAVIYPASGNSCAGSNSVTSMGSSTFNIDNIPQGSSIGSANNWSSSSGALGLVAEIVIPGLYSTSYSTGPFLGTTGFVGLKFNAGGNTHFGWVRVEVGADGEFLSIKDYAFDATPNTPIVAGETGSGPVGISENNDFVNVQNLHNSIRIETADSYNDAVLSLVSISGQLIVSQQLNGTITLINTDEIASGVYVLTINSDNKSYNQKVYLK